MVVASSSEVKEMLVAPECFSKEDSIRAEMSSVSARSPAVGPSRRFWPTVKRHPASLVNWLTPSWSLMVWRHPGASTGKVQETGPPAEGSVEDPEDGADDGDVGDEAAVASWAP